MANVHGRRIRGNLGYWDTHRMRLVDAIGPDVVAWELEAKDAQPTAGTATQPRGYTTTLVETGGAESDIEASDEAGFRWEIITDAFDNDGVSVQLNGEAFRPTGRDIYFGIALRADEATQSDFLVGLCITDTALLGGMTDGIYFRKVDASASIAAVTEKNSTETEAAEVGTLVANTTIILEFYFDGATVYFFVNGVQVAAHTANIPDDEALTPSIEFLTGEAVAHRMKVAWGRAFAIG